MSNSSQNSFEVLAFVKSLLSLLIAFFLIRGTAIQAFKIPSGSMKPTLMIGDHILVTKFNYGFRLPFVNPTIWQYAHPKRGDVVVFTRPDDLETLMNEDKTHFIKRVIGVPGDIVEVKGTKVFVNNKQLDEKGYEVWWEDGGRSNFGPKTVPEGKLFLMGDNRDRSKDSRYWFPYHFLDIKRVQGKALIVYWSFDSLSRIFNLIK